MQLEQSTGFHTQALAELDGKTAEILVAEGRADAVLKYIDMLSVGPAG